MHKLYNKFLGNLLSGLVILLFTGQNASAQTATLNRASSPICSGSVGSFIFDVNGGTAPYVVSYSDGLNNKTITTDLAGHAELDTVLSSNTTITITSIQNNGGGSVGSGVSNFINVQALPTANFSTNNYDLCKGTLVNLQVLLTGTGNLNFQIRDNSNGLIVNSTGNTAGTVNVSVTPLITTTYYITSITDNLGCVGDDSASTIATVKDTLKVNIIAPDQICASTPVDVSYAITGTGGLYNLYYKVGGSDSTKLNVGASVTDSYASLTSTTTFTVDSVKYASGSACKVSNAASKTVNLNALPTADLLESNDTVCTGNTTQLRFAVTGGGTIFVRYKSSSGATGVTSSTQAASPAIANITPGVNDTKYFIDSVWSVNGTANCTNTFTSDTTRIFLREKPNILLTENKNVICEGESVVFTANVSGSAQAAAKGPFRLNYLINGVANQEFLPLGSSTFSKTFTSNTVIQLLSIVDASDQTCTTNLTQVINITVKPTAKANFGNSAILCEGKSDSLRLSFTGTSPYQFTINGVSYQSIGDTVIGVTPTATTVYTLQQLVDNVGCVATPNSTVTMTVRPKPAVVFTVSSNEVCVGSSIDLQLNLSGGNAPYSVFFSGESTPFNPINVPNGNTSYSRLINSSRVYRLDSIRDNSAPFACTFSIGQTQSVVAQPIPSATISVNDNTICLGEAITLSFNVTGTGVDTVYWSGTDGLNGSVIGSTGILSTNIIPNASGNVVYRVDSIHDGSAAKCTSNGGATVNVTVSPTPTATISGSGSICQGNTLPISLALTGNGSITVNYKDSNGQNYTYTNVAGNYVVPVSVTNYSGPISFTITNVNGSSTGATCVGTSSGSANFTIVKAPTATISSNNTNIVSGGTSTLLFSVTGTGPFDIVYTDGTNNFSLLNVPISGTSVNVSPSTTTTYSILSVVDKGTAPSLCSATNQGNVTIIVSNAVASISGNATICLGDSFAAFVSFNSAGPFNIVVGDGNGNNQNFNNLVDGNSVFIKPVTTGTLTYRILSVTDVNTSSVSTNTAGQAIVNVVQQKTVTISGNTTICEGNSSTLTFTLQGSGTFNVFYTDGTKNYSFSATAANSPVIRTIPAIDLNNGVNTYTITNVTNSNPSSVCNIVFSGSATITVRPTPVVNLSFDENPTCAGSANKLNFTFPSAGPFDVALTTDSNSTITIDTLRGIGTGFSRNFVSNSPVRFTATQVKYSTAPSCVNTTNQSIQLTVRNKPSGVISGTGTICSGSSTPVRFVLNGTLPIQVTYSNGVSNSSFTVRTTLDTSINVSPSVSRTYTIVSLADGNTPSCQGTGTGSAVITVRPQPNVAISLNNNSICESQSARLKFDCSGTPPFTINYTENGVARIFTANVVGESELTVSPSSTTTYTLVSVSSGSAPACTANLSGSTTLTVIPRPNVVLSTTTPQVCEGQTARIRANVSGQGNVQVRITNVGATYDTTFVVTAGTYFFNVNPAIGNNIYTAVLVSDQSALSCTRTNASSVSITAFQKPTGTISTSSEVCEGSSINLNFTINGSGLMTVNYANDRGFVDAFTTTGGSTVVTVNPAPETGSIKYYITSIQSQNGVICTGVSTDTAIAIVNAAPVVSISSNQKTICRGDSTQLIFSASGNGPFQVDYTDGNTNFTLNLVGDNNGDGLFDRSVWVKPSQTTTFRVLQVRDNSSPTCASNNSVAYTVIVNQKPTASISGTTAICAGDSVSLTFAINGKAPLTLVYAGDGNTFTIPLLSSGTLRLDTVKPSASTNYTIVSITDSNSPTCTTSPGQGVATITVNPKPQASMSLSSNVKCANDSVDLVFTVSGGQAPYTVVYSAGGLNDTISFNTSPFLKRVGPTSTTVYELLSVKENSITKCATFYTGQTQTLTVNPLPTVSFSSNVSAVCNGDAVQLKFIGTGGNDLTVNYTMNGTAQAPVSLNTDTDSDGKVDATVSNIPSILVTGDSAVYNITSVTNNSNTCTNPSAQQVKVFVNELPTASLINANPNVVCEGDTSVLNFTVTGKGNITVVFRHLIGAVEQKRDSVSGPAGNLQFKVVPFNSTSYEIVSVYSVNNGLTCSGSVSGSSMASVNVNPKPTISLSATANPICVGGSTQIVVNMPTGTPQYSYEYVVKTKGQAPDTNSVFNQISGSTINLFNLTDTTVVYIYKLLDSAVPACSNTDSTGIRIDVNPNSSARIYGDSVYCTSQQAGFFLDLVGIGNITVSYRDNFGNVYPAITRTAGTHFIPISQAVGTRTYTLISVADQSNPACNGSVSGLGKVRVVNPPSAIFSGVSGICEGDVSTFTIQLTGGAADTVTVYYHDNFGNQYSYSNRPGVYDVLHTPADSSVYTPDSVKYKFIACGGGVTGKGQIDVRPTPEGSINVSTEICNGQSVTATFNLAYNGPFDITYQIGSNPAVNVNQVLSGYQVNFTPSDTTTIKLSQIIYSDIPLCTAVNVDQKTVNVNDSIKVVLDPKVCNNINTGYTLKLNISGGQSSSYTVNSVNSTPVYQSAFIPNGPYSFTISDNSGCPSVVVNGADTCACTSFSGTMGVLATLEFCDDQVASSIHNDDHVKDANDTLIFVITDRNDGVIGNVFATNYLPSFTYNSSMAFETTYYIVPVVSDTTGDPGFSTSDRCLSVGTGTPIIWHQNSRVNVEILKNDSGQNCVGDMMTIRFVFTGNGALGPYNLVFNPGFGGDITRTVNGPVYVETVGPIPSSGSIKIKQFEDLSLTTGCSRVVDFDSAYPYIGRPLPISNFNISDNQICQGESVIFTPSVVDPTARYTWVFGDNGISQAISPSHPYNIAGTFNSYLTVTNSFGCTSTSSVIPIEVQPTPDAKFAVSPGTGPYCYGTSIDKEITFTDVTNYAPGGNVNWFINGTLQPEVGGPGTQMKRRFSNPGTYVIKMTFTSPFGCIDSSVTSITVEGPKANVAISSVLPCVESLYTFQLNNVSDVSSFTWNFSGIGYNQTVSNANPSNVSFPRNSPNGTSIIANLKMTGASGCTFDSTFSITVYQSTAQAIVSPAQHCQGTSFALSQTSSPAGGPNAITNWNWSFGNGSGLPNVTGASPGSFVYPQSGTYKLTLEVTGAMGCKHTDTLDVLVLENPNVFMANDTVCDDMLIKRKKAQVLNYVAGNTYSFNWNVVPLAPGLSINFIQGGADTSVANFNVNGTGTFPVFVEVTNGNTGCKSTASATFTQFILANPANVVSSKLDTAYAIGYDLDFAQASQYNFNLNNPLHKYSWSPSTGVSCDTCPNPVISTLTDALYELRITDIYGCYPMLIPVNIDILEVESIDLPDAFTPNGDNINETIFPDGLALKSVEEFVVFNRFGDVVHRASGSKQQVAWDGKLNGKVQQQDVYTYRAIINTFTGKRLVKTGKFTLIR